ncbi:MAG: DUF2007 domain-containing protein [Lutibacter sp.]|uniref:putative signal transducing protein n=1 Tax=Lutibacter sp. TaxID=1925666 RepID=UPI00299DA186|nr:DUF2007 domain-containing protein [Lutibacter sp.]MDX1828899.1 DUF2007 domain-containing protein [Lutibacter sp.]
MHNHSDTLITLLETSLIHEIHIAKTLLATYDIPSYIFDENLTTIGIPVLEGYKLKVNELDFENAKQILATTKHNN